MLPTRRSPMPLLPLVGVLLAVSTAGLTLQGGRRAAGPPILPDPRLTPGDVLPVTKDDICVSGYARKVRSVPAAVKRQAYALYNITRRAPGEYEVDHLISLELGGSNSLRNLWPESYRTRPWNARVKDQLENELHRRVCDEGLDLKTAQRDIARNWIEAYKRTFRTQLPLAKAPRRSSHSRTRRGRLELPGAPAVRSSIPPQPPATGRGLVWVNLSSGKYWLPGSRYYGKTERGEYMSEAQARRRGYTKAGGQ